MYGAIMRKRNEYKKKLAQKLLQVCSIEDGTMANNNQLTTEEILQTKQHLTNLITMLIRVENGINLDATNDNFQQDDGGSDDAA